jgi:hypothetical protein
VWRKRGRGRGEGGVGRVERYSPPQKYVSSCREFLLRILKEGIGEVCLVEQEQKVDDRL